MSPSNIFTVNLISKGEPHLLQIPSNTPNGIPLGIFFFLSCEIGIGGQSTFLHVFVNGREIKNEELSFTTDISELSVHGGVIGADLNTNNMGSFDLMSVSCFKSALIPEDLIKIKQYHIDHPHTKYFEYNGTKWMRIKKFGRKDLEQKDERFQPALRDFNGSINLQ